MKRFLVLILGIALFACTQKQHGFMIEVKLDGADGQILLEQRGKGEWIAIDTADVIEGVAVLTGEVEFPSEYYLSVIGKRPKTMIFVENRKINVSGHADSLNLVKVTGSATHDEYLKVYNQINSVTEEYMDLYRQAREAGQAGDTAKSRTLMEQVYDKYNSIGVMQEDFIKNNPASYISPYFLSRIQYEKEVEQLDSLLNILDPKMDVVPSVVDLKERVELLKKLAVGKTAPDFVMNDPDGNPVRFSDIYSENEVTLLDFWAAWCGPCRAENPNVVAVFNDYKDKGFTVFGVSLDRTKEDWLKAISDDGLTWTHVSDLAYWNNAAAQMYAVNSIPSSLLVDKTGTIIAKNKRGDELRAAVAEKLN